MIIENNLAMGPLCDPPQHDVLDCRLKRTVAPGGAPSLRPCEGRYGVSRFGRLVGAIIDRGARRHLPAVLRRASIRADLA